MVSPSLEVAWFICCSHGEKTDLVVLAVVERFEKSLKPLCALVKDDLCIDREQGAIELTGRIRYLKRNTEAPRKHDGIRR